MIFSQQVEPKWNNLSWLDLERISKLVPVNFFDIIYHVRSGFNMHSIIASRLIAGGRIHVRDRQTVFFTTVDPMEKKVG